MRLGLELALLRLGLEFALLRLGLELALQLFKGRASQGLPANRVRVMGRVDFKCTAAGSGSGIGLPSGARRTHVSARHVPLGLGLELFVGEGED